MLIKIYLILSTFRTTVRLGEHNISTVDDCIVEPTETICAEPVQDIPVESVTIHENYSSTKFANDIALIRLARPADPTKSNVNTICLPETIERAVLQQNTRLTIAGWGQTENSRGISDELLKATVPFVSLEKCDEIFKNASKNVQLYEQSDTCRGDSGNFKPFN